MANLIAGDRVGRRGRLAVGCSASVFDRERGKMLLVRRTDNGRWCVPGGYMEPGESTTEGCVREVWEETGLTVRVVRLIGVYTNPHQLVEYPDGNAWQLVVLHFEAETVAGELATSSETSEVAYFTQAEAANLDMMGLDRARVSDGFAGQVQTAVHDTF